MSKEEILELGKRKLEALQATAGCADVVVFENPDYASALIGLTEDMRAVYSYSRMIEHLEAVDEMDELDAADFIDFNTVRALPYINNGPVIMYDLLEE